MALRWVEFQASLPADMPPEERVQRYRRYLGYDDVQE